METEPPVRYVVTEEQLEDLIYHHQDLVRCAFQRNSTAAADMNCDKAMAACRKIEVPYWATHFAKVRTETDGHQGHWHVLDQSEPIP